MFPSFRRKVLPDVKLFSEKWRAAALCLALCGAAPVHADELVVLVDTGTEMPMARINGGLLLGGLHKDLGEALAVRLGRAPRFLLLPRKRIEVVLENGGADLLCLYQPAWLPEHKGWSQAFFPFEDVLIADRSVRRPLALAELAGRPVGTLFGYRYPELERALGEAFVRDDAPSSESNVRKMAAGRVHYALTTRLELDYRRKTGALPELHPPLLLKRYRTQCALSARSRISLAELNHAIDGLVGDGTLDAIVLRYR